MDNAQDQKLAELLDSYHIGKADKSLLDRIVAQAAQTEPLEAASRHAWIKKAAMLAAIAVLGFWFGSASFSAPSHLVAAQSSCLDRVILGPVSFEEVML
jgi:hypothetical protein